MLAVKGIFDGRFVTLKDAKIPAEPQEVIVTFLGDTQEDLSKDINSILENGKSFAFLDDEEDLYTDHDLKIKY
jgi:hypothetical protein